MDPHALATLGRRAIGNLARWQARPRFVDEAPLEPEQWTGLSCVPVGRIRAALDDPSSEAADHTACDEAHDAAAKILSVFLHVAGRADLARRVRRTRREDLEKTAEDEPVTPAVGGSRAGRSRPGRAFPDPPEALSRPCGPSRTAWRPYARGGRSTSTPVAGSKLASLHSPGTGLTRTTGTMSVTGPAPGGGAGVEASRPR